MVLLPITIGVCVARYGFHFIHTFLFVDHREAGTRKIPTNKKSWIVRLFLLVGITVSMSFGYYAFAVLKAMNLAHVKIDEYIMIVVPVQMNIGILIGTVMQFKMEKRIAMKEAQKLAAAKAEDGAADEKQALLDV